MVTEGQGLKIILIISENKLMRMLRLRRGPINGRLLHVFGLITLSSHSPPAVSHWAQTYVSSDNYVITFVSTLLWTG